MQRLHFTCTLLSDVVLSAQAATEGFHLSLDYLPGAKFLGLLAKNLYDLNKEQQTLDLFHNACVRFGDAHRCDDQHQLFYKTPFSWHLPKTGGDHPYLHHKLDSATQKKLLNEGVLLKAMPSGYVNASHELVHTAQGFSIKSDYNPVKKRAEDEKMYGYYALPKGSKWLFCVDTDKGEYADLIRTHLCGQQRLGRSSSAEYGLVEIAELKQESQIPPPKIPAGETYLYAFSNWCFYDQNGQCTLQPDPQQDLGLPEGSWIDWKKSQIRTRNYQTWNRHRSNRDADRVVIEQGSVLVVQVSKEFDSDALQKGIGSHRNEGMGQVSVNPAFLQSSTIQVTTPLRKIEIAASQVAFSYVQQGPNDQLLLDYLAGKLREKSAESLIDQQVNLFIEKHQKRFDGITSSQWGQVRNIAKHANSSAVLYKLLFEPNFGFCNSGQSQNKWQEKGRAQLLMTFIFEETKDLADEDLPELTLKLASEMAKAAQND